jgi:hypothetical protein
MMIEPWRRWFYKHARPTGFYGAATSDFPAGKIADALAAAAAVTPRFLLLFASRLVKC